MQTGISNNYGTWLLELHADGKVDVISFAAAEPRAMRGVGDLIARATKAVGIQPCQGCQKRQEALNAIMPFKDAQK
jgi:hypothetical protein